MSDVVAAEPAPRYTRGSGELWILTCHFNPARYETKSHNLEAFLEPIVTAGIPILVVQCEFGHEAFPRLGVQHVVRVRARDVLWQKERLLNLGLAALPPECTKVAWIDADLLFTNGDWVPAAEAVLDVHPVAQLFERAYRLPPGTRSYAAGARCWPSLASRWQQAGLRIFTRDFGFHGHTGFAWAARRDVLAQHGLYDACIAGGGDHVMAHAMCGDWSSSCALHALGRSRALFDHFEPWAVAMHRSVQGDIGCVPGDVLHLWHGAYEDRQYDARGHELARHGFDPHSDLRVAPSGCWEWASEKPHLRRWAYEYFSRRREDPAARNLRA